MAASRVKSVSFKDDEKELLQYCEEQGNFSEFMKKLALERKNKGYKFDKEQEKTIIEMIKKYAPTVKDEDIKKDFDKEKLEALGQFDNM